MPLRLEGSAEKLDPQERQKLHAAMVLAAVGLRRCRTRKLHRDWTNLNRDKIPIYASRYYQKNRAAIRATLSRPERRARKAAWSKAYQKKPDYLRRRKEMYQRNCEAIKAKSRAFATSPRGRKLASENQKRRRKDNPNYHFLNWIRGDINRSLRRQSARKCARKEELIGCSYAEYRAHLESQFGTEFTWANRASTWDADHIVPVAKFDLQDPDEQRCCFNWKNIRPMNREKNQSKSDTVTLPLADWIPAPIAARILRRMTK